MPLYMNRRAILIKREVTPGVDAAPVAATDGIELHDFEVSPLEVSYVERKTVRPFFGAYQQIPTGKFVKISGKMPIAGFGTAGPAVPTPGYSALMRCCGMSEAITATTKVDYKPVSTAFDAATVYYYHDGRLHKALNVRGDMSLVLKRNELPYYSFELTGVYVPVTDSALVVPTLTAFAQPMSVALGNTTAFTLHGVSTLCLESLELKLGNSVVYRNLVNCSEQVLITDRISEGSIEIEDTLIAVKDWYATILAATTAGLTITQGTAAGNKVVISSGSVQLTSPKFTESDTLVHLQMGMRFVPTTAGNDEFTISVQ